MTTITSPALPVEQRSAEPERAIAQPPTAEQIAASEKAMGLQPTAAAMPAVKAPVRMGLSPQTIDEGYRLAQMFARSELVPKNFRNKPEDVLVAIQMGMELGLAPMQALASIAVVNGRASVWGDGLLALILSSTTYQDHDEFYEVEGQRRDGLSGDDLKKDTTTAVCTFVRRNKTTPVTRRFSIGQAKKAGLWTKTGPWADYPDRMLAMRARGFAARDAFPDLLRGIRTAEEVMDMPDESAPAIDVPREGRRVSDAKATEKPMPDGYEAWVASLDMAATSGAAALTARFLEAPLPLREYLTKTDAARWEALKDRAMTAGTGATA